MSRPSSFTVAYVGIATCGHIRAAWCVDESDPKDIRDAGREAARWVRDGLRFERRDNIETVRVQFGSCSVCDPKRHPSQRPLGFAR